MVEIGGHRLGGRDDGLVEMAVEGLSSEEQAGKGSVPGTISFLSPLSSQTQDVLEKLIILSISLYLSSLDRVIQFSTISNGTPICRNNKLDRLSRPKVTDQILPTFPRLAR